MRYVTLPAVLFAASLALGCGDPAAGPTQPLRADVEVRFSKGDIRNHRAHLTGAAERPVPVETPGQGQLKLQLSADGETLSYRLIASNLENVFQAHLHLGTADGTGGIVVWLYPDGPPAGLHTQIAGRHSGVLAEGEITASRLVGALAGQPLGALLSAIADGRIYVNVHTNDFVAPTNTGPGDFPAGEIRGQVESGSGG